MSPVQLSHDTRSLWWVEREEERRAKARKALSVPGKRLSPHTGGTDTRPRANIPSLPNRTGQPHHLCVLPASPSVSRRLTDRAPEFSRVVPPLAVSPLPTRRPPAGAKVFSTRRRKDAGPGLPGSSRGLPERREGAQFAAQRVD